jgi:hypothetical protein
MIQPRRLRYRPTQIWRPARKSTELGIAEGTERVTSVGNSARTGAARPSSAQVFRYLSHERFDERDEVRPGYVAMTRTTERLVLAYHREAGFAKRLLARHGALFPPPGYPAKLCGYRVDSIKARGVRLAR